MPIENNFDFFLGKPIIEFKEKYSFLGGFRPEEDLHTIIMEDFVFCDIKFNTLHLYVNDNKIIQSVIFVIPKIIDISLYRTMIKRYGDPYEMIKKDQTTYNNPTTRNGITSKEGVYTVKDCTFKENPLFITWKKNGYKIKVTLKHEYNISEIKFNIIE